MAIITVGNNKQHSTISAAVAASNSGDTVNVDAGTYTNDFITISHNLTLQAVGGVAKLVATQAPPNGKGIIDEGGSGTNVTITGFDISGAQVPDGNGAGVRYEGGRLTLNNDTIHGNQDGLLANSDPNGTITISGSVFAANGSGDGYTHNIYVGDVGSLTVQDSTIVSAVVGHQIKSRAESTTITNNTIVDGANGTASYDIDLPNGGKATITGNIIEKGPNAQNPTAISFGEEGNVYANSSLTVQGNTMLNDERSHRTTVVVNDTRVTATISGNDLYGWSAVASGPASVSNNTTLTSEPALSSLTPGSASNSGGANGSVGGSTATSGTGTATTDTSAAATGAPATGAPASGAAPSGAAGDTSANTAGTGTATPAGSSPASSTTAQNAGIPISAASVGSSGAPAFIGTATGSGTQQSSSNTTSAAPTPSDASGLPSLGTSALGTPPDLLPGLGSSDALQDRPAGPSGSDVWGRHPLSSSALAAPSDRYGTPGLPQAHSSVP